MENVKIPCGFCEERLKFVNDQLQRRIRELQLEVYEKDQSIKEMELKMLSKVTGGTVAGIFKCEISKLRREFEEMEKKYIEVGDKYQCMLKDFEVWKSAAAVYNRMAKDNAAKLSFAQKQIGDLQRLLVAQNQQIQMKDTAIRNHLASIMSMGNVLHPRVPAIQQNAIQPPPSNSCFPNGELRIGSSYFFREGSNDDD